VLAQLEPLLELQAKHGIVTAAYGPLTPILRHPTGGPLKPVLERIGAAHGIDAASVLLLWTVQKGVVAVTSSKNEANIRKIAALDSAPDLSAEEIKQIDEAGKQVHFRHYTEHMTKDYPAPELPQDV
jgi:diketogulonate reductase-like aldo/keto reductase